MGDQVQFLNKDPKHFQIGEPGAPCGGSSTCTDCTISMIVFRETGVFWSAHDVRQKAAPHKDPCRGLNPEEAIRGIRDLGVKGYHIHINATSEDAIRATNAGVVLVAVGYDGYPVVSEAEVGGKTDLNFNGPHALPLFGRRNWQKKPVFWPKGKPFKPGWRVWDRDPDHHWGAKTPPYHRYRSAYLTRAMDAIIGNEGWKVRLIIAREPGTWHQKSLLGIEEHAVSPLATNVAEFPDFGAGQQG